MRPHSTTVIASDEALDSRRLERHLCEVRIEMVEISSKDDEVGLVHGVLLRTAQSKDITPGLRSAFKNCVKRHLNRTDRRLSKTGLRSLSLRRTDERARRIQRHRRD